VTFLDPRDLGRDGVVLGLGVADAAGGGARGVRAEQAAGEQPGDEQRSTGCAEPGSAGRGRAGVLVVQGRQRGASPF
jgi:hypothetical protein